MRGKGRFLCTEHPPSRITPAYAGKSITVKVYTYMWMGSPPPMRGKVFYSFAVLNGFGITPAYAGKSPAIY